MASTLFLHVSKALNLIFLACLMKIWAHNFYFLSLWWESTLYFLNSFSILSSTSSFLLYSIYILSFWRFNILISSFLYIFSNIFLKSAVAFLHVLNDNSKSGFLMWFNTNIDPFLYFSRNFMYIRILQYALIEALYPFIDSIILLINLYRRLFYFFYSYSFFFWNRGDCTKFPSSF